MIDRKILTNIGFTKAEAVVYLQLLKLGKTKSGAVINSTGLQSSVVHNALNNLIEKGFATYILEGKIKNYSALNPKFIEKSIENKKQEFKEILPKLLSLKQKSNEIKTITEVYEGWNGLQSATIKMLENTKKGDIFKYFAMDKSNITNKAIEFFSKTDLIKKSKGIIIKGIAKNENTNIFKDYKNSIIKYTSLNLPPAMNICKDKILIFSLTEKPKAILIQSKEISKQYHQLWDSIWKIAKVK